METSFRKNIYWTVFLAACAFVFSFASQIVISYFYGTSAELDAYWAAYAIVNLMVFPVHPFREALVPEIHKRSLETSSANASEYFSRALTLILFIAIIGFLLSWFFPDFLSRLVVNSSANQLQALVAKQLVWFAPAIVLLAISETLNSLLASYHAVILQSASRLMAAGSSLAIIGMMAGVMGIKALVLGFISGQLMTIVVLLFVINKHGLTYRLAWPSNLGKAFYALSGALLINYSASQAYAIYEKYIFSGFSKGLISAFQYGVSLTNVLITILGLSIANVFWPRFLKYAANKDLEKAGQETSIALKMIFLGMGVICSIIYFNADVIIDVLFVRGAFDADSALRTSQALRATIFTAVPITIASVLGRVLISFGATKNVMSIGIVTAFSGFIVLWIAQKMGLYELAILHWLLANSISCVISGILFIKLLHRPLNVYLKSMWWILRLILTLSAAIALTQFLIQVIYGSNRGIVISLLSVPCLVLLSAVIAILLGLTKGFPNPMRALG